MSDGEHDSGAQDHKVDPTTTGQVMHNTKQEKRVMLTDIIHTLSFRWEISYS